MSENAIYMKENPKLGVFVTVISEDFVKNGWMTFDETDEYIHYKMTDVGVEQLNKIVDSLPQDALVRIQKAMGI